VAVVGIVLGAAALTGCRVDGGVNGVSGGAVPASPTVPGQSFPVQSFPADPGATGPPANPAASTTVPTPPSSSPSSSPPLSPSATAGPSSTLVLGGDELGVTRVGASFREAVAAVTTVLGPPAGDPAVDASCVGAVDETTWGSFRLGGNDGKLTGWVSKSTTVATPSGVKVGTTQADLRRAYGARLLLAAPTPDAGPLFEVEGAGLSGGLTGPAASATVSFLFNGTCTPP